MMECTRSLEIVLIVLLVICSTEAWPLFNFFGLTSEGSGSSEETTVLQRNYFNPFPVSSEEEEENLQTSRPAIRIQNARTAKDLSQSRIRFPTDERDHPTLDVDPDQALKFLHQFGYLGTGPYNTGALYSKETVEEALMKLQRFGSIPQTGELDEPTAKLLKSPRCGNTDIGDEARRRRRKRFIVGSQGWNKRSLTYHVERYSGRLTNQSAVDHALKTAFRAWSKYSNLRFIPRKRRENADIIINFARYDHGDSYPFDGSGRTLAHAYYPYQFADFGGDIHFDDDEEWTSEFPAQEKGVDFFTVAVHEIGHALGLSHSPDQNSIMFPYYKGPEAASTFSIGYDDVLAMYELYIGRPLKDNHVDYHDDQEDSTGSKVDTESDATVSAIPTSSTTTSSTTSATKTTTTTTITTTTTETSFESTDYQNDAAPDVEATSNDLADLCKDPSYDAFGIIRSELFLFKGKMMWRYSRRGALFPNYPVDFHQMFSGFPDEVDHIDALYERPTDGAIVFFSGNQYWIYNGYQFIENTPLPLSYLGLPTDVKKLDTAFVWGKNEKTYFFRENIYWRFDEYARRIEDGYPFKIGHRWHGVPNNLQAVFTDTTGVTYFFKDNWFLSFDDFMVKAEERNTNTISRFWFNCPS
ncbi:72 kDa type IV collagenase-like [Tigriopus californicus]|uniref:72 kDa type IV collagenase-like n=1 Tax=Tigriopus californicus TaxID=6832 RepID=UPI0027D9CF06|nr:72 kDa type IV collagenase-like [Tigriopus californicus]